MIKKMFSGLFIVLMFMGLSTTSAEAALVTVRDGGIFWNVLSAEDIATTESRVAVKFREIAQATIDEVASTKVDLVRDGEQLKVRLELDGFGQEADVSGFSHEIIEVREISGIESVRIYADGENFQINHQGVDAFTTYPVRVDASRQKVSLDVNGEFEELTALPGGVVLGLVNNKIISATDARGVSVITDEEGGLQYSVLGRKIIKLFAFLEVSVPVSVTVSAETGELLENNKPLWLSLFDDFFPTSREATGGKGV